MEVFPLAPPITVGLMSEWKVNQEDPSRRKIVYTNAAITHMWFFHVVTFDKTYMFAPICDALASGFLPKVEPGTPVCLLEVTDGFIDLDDQVTVQTLLKTTGDVNHPLTLRGEWLIQLRNFGVKQRQKPGASVNIGANFSTFATTSDMPMASVRLTAYLWGRLMTLWCIGPSVDPVCCPLSSLSVAPNCPIIRSPSEHLLRHGSRLSLLTLAATALSGAAVGVVRSFASRRSMRKSRAALRALSWMSDSATLDATGRRLALEASDLLVPGATVDRGAGAVVRWVESRSPKWWKRYAPAALAAASATVMWSNDTSRAAAVAASVAFAADGMVRAGAERPKVERTGLKQHTTEMRTSLLKGSKAVLLGLLKQSASALRVMSPRRLRVTVIAAMPRVLELLFTDPGSGKPYPPDEVLERVVLYPGLLRPQLYTTRV
jgi:hypothetical protein